MKTFSSSAPCKAILFGEHYVVYGSPALALAIEPRNVVEFSGDGEREGIFLKSALGSGRITGGCAYFGEKKLAIYAEVARAVFGDAKLPGCTAEFLPSWNLKGVGTSASLCAAFAAGLYRLKGGGVRAAGAGRIFAAAQAGDLLAHGGRASGIDAQVVSSGKPMVFARKFSPPAFSSKPAEFSLPPGTRVLLIDTCTGKRDGTQKMLEAFAAQFWITGSPADATEGQREKVRAEYAGLWERIEKMMKAAGRGTGAGAKTLGALMNENHALLRKRRMTSDGIERAVSAALSAGALGAKLTGGGGEGGAVLALCEKDSSVEISEVISEETGFPCHPLVLAKHGATDG